MTKLALGNCDIYTGEAILPAHAVVIDGGRVLDVCGLDSVPADAVEVDLHGKTLAPAFVDLQVNGGGGVLLTDSPTVDAIRTVALAHRRLGTAYLMPTFVSAPPEVFAAARAALDEYSAAGDGGVLGVHFEGPLLNPARAGAHDIGFISSEPDPRVLAAYFGAGRTLVTLAPEIVPELVSTLRERGVFVAIGHSEAGPSEVAAAVADGASLGTHVFNAMAPLTARDPGTAGALLAEDGAWCSFICDGLHVDFAVLKTAFRAKPRGKALLVSDAMPCVGSDITEFWIGDLHVRVDDEGRCVTEGGALAGASIDMATAVRNAVQRIGVPEDEALRMASLYPAQYLGVADRLGSIAPGYEASFVVLDDELHVERVYFRGQEF